MMLYRFFIRIGSHYGIETEVFPLNYREAEFSVTKESDNIFFRIKLDQELTFSNSQKDGIFDYDFLHSLLVDPDSQCLRILFEIRRSCDNGWTYENYWNGYFSLTDGDWDIDKCTFDVKMSVDDIYRCIMENRNKDVNILEASPSIDATAQLLAENYEFFICRGIAGSCVLPDPSPGATWLIFHQEIFNGQSNIIYYREQAVTACLAGVATPPPGGGWILDTTYNNCTFGLARFVRLPTTVYPNNPNPEVAAGDCLNPYSALDSVLGFVPKSQRLTVSKTNTPTTPPIESFTDIAILTSGPYDETYTFRVPDNPGSTYVWDVVEGAFFTIFTGAGTNEITGKFVTTGGTRTIRVVETSICGVLPAVTKAIDVQLAGDLTHPFTEFLVVRGAEQVCLSAKSTYTILDPGTNYTIVWSVSAGSSIFSGQGTTSVVILWSSLVSSGFVSCTINNSVVTAPITLIGNLQVDITRVTKTPPIVGITSLCPSSTGTPYSVFARDPAATYMWIVTGGTIASGQTTNSITVNWNSTVENGLVRVKETIDCGCNFIQIVTCGANEDQPSFWWCPIEVVVEVLYPNGRPLESVISYILAQMGCPFNIVSDFFEINPDGTAPNYVPGNNYVTGTTNFVDHLALFQKSDIIDPIATNKATKGLLKFEELMKYLRTMFNVYWFIDGVNFRLEHISYFQRGIAFDLTTPQYFEYIEGLNQFSYTKLDMPKYERFTWMEAFNLDFVGAEISYDSLCVNQDPDTNVKIRPVERITTDIQYINDFPADISKDGFVMLTLDDDGTVLFDVGQLSGTFFPNAHLSWANLHWNYLRYDRVLLQGNMNLQLTNFFTALRGKIQKDIEFPYCCEDESKSLNDFIKTQIGLGVIKSGKISVEKETLTVDLLHDTF